MNYVQFPILVVGRFGNDKVKGVVQLGPYISYWTGGYTQNSVSIDKQSKNASTYKYIFTSNDKEWMQDLLLVPEQILKLVKAG
ncbi:MAG: hypothetical protein R2807_05580 [Chitinophagales bacterium]